MCTGDVLEMQESRLNINYSNSFTVGMKKMEYTLVQGLVTGGKVFQWMN